ncbi:hypothetical protein ACOMHN_036359 [Nucella lapillus]
MQDTKSIRSNQRVRATFRNISERKADLYWVDFSGKLVQYSRDLGPGEESRISTYVTHPWVARDSVTGQWLAVCGKSVYVTPKPGGDGDNADDADEETDGAHARDVGPLEILIHIPVYRLEDLCIGFLRRHLQQHSTLTTEQLSGYLLDRVATIPTLTARVYHPQRGITDQ